MNTRDDLHPVRRAPLAMKIDVAVVLGLLIWWPLLLLAVAFVVPTIAVAAVLAAVVAAIAAPIWLLVSRVRAHHGTHRSIPFPRRMRP